MFKKISIFVIQIYVLLSCSPYNNLKKMEFSELEYPFSVKTIELKNDIKLAYIDEGDSKETIIFIHGLGSYLPAWKKNIAELKKNFRCIAIDLPGYGKSSKDTYPFTMEFYAEVLSEMMEKLEITSATIAGHSMGGQIAIVMSLKFPDKVDKLILVSPAGFEKFTDGEKQWFREVMTVKLVKLTSVQQIRANIVVNFYDMSEDAEFMITDRIALRGAENFDKYCYTVVKSVEGMVDQPVHHMLNKIKQPTLILFGENDGLIPNPYLHGGFTEDIAKYGAERIPDNKLIMYEKTGHFVQFERWEKVNQDIIEFINK